MQQVIRFLFMSCLVVCGLGFGLLSFTPVSFAQSIKQTVPVTSTLPSTITNSITATLMSTATQAVTATAVTTGTQPAYYVVRSGDTLFLIAQRFQIDLDLLVQVNKIRDANMIDAGALLTIPGSDGTLPDPTSRPIITPIRETLTPSVSRGTILDRMTPAAQKVTASSPFYKTTWLTYYGRPNIPVMGILGEYDLDKLTLLLQRAAKVYDQANGRELGVMPAFHLVYGMATKAPGDDNSYLSFLTDEVVKAYVERAQKENFAVILDIQIGALKPAESIKASLPWLKYKNVHLAIDPEFAMATKNQAWPGDPIGFITAQQVNEVQAAMQQYMIDNKIDGTRVLLVHQFQDDMIVDKAKLDEHYQQVALTISADGWGDPWGKITKYNAFVDQTTKFGAFKLFYKWDEPLMTERQVLGIDPYSDSAYIEVTPNLIIYQ